MTMARTFYRPLTIFVLAGLFLFVAPHAHALTCTPSTGNNPCTTTQNASPQTGVPFSMTTLDFATNYWSALQADALANGGLTTTGPEAELNNDSGFRLLGQRTGLLSLLIHAYLQRADTKSSIPALPIVRVT